ncbi:MAG: NADH-ubiquinone oxidoreductase-F iron-sulfur binding region domain-containing protein [Elusimicrobiota bacterium]
MNKTKVVFIKDTAVTSPDRTDEFFSSFYKSLNEKNLKEKVQLTRTEFVGLYDKGIVVKIWPDNIVYSNVSEKDIEEIINRSILSDEVIDSLNYKPEDKLLRVVLRNCGKIDPESIDEYISAGGYAPLKKALGEKSPEDILGELKTSGLRGRGGGGFPTWRKWSFSREAPADRKFIICNADEGDPGAYMDRSVLEGDPHSVIEGMIIGGYTSGAQKGYFYIRAEYPLAIKRVSRAIEKAYEYGFLGENIMGSGFSFDLDIRLGAGAFVCGEETALIASIEGKRGTPRPRPPYPSIKGLWDKPTIINNVETLANIPVIIDKGGKWFSGIGTDTSKGTKVFALTGKVKNSGLIEVPMGTTLREIVYDIGGGLAHGHEIKAVQTGGPSGGMIPAEYIDTPVDYENLQQMGSIMGSGGMIVIGSSDCMIDVARFYLRFCVDESCGKCPTCRIGGYQLLMILNHIAKGSGKPEHIEKIKAISKAMAKASLCGLGQTAPNPVFSTLKYFRDEYVQHIEEKKCKAGKCSDLMSFSIIQEKCTRCSLCFKKCPVNAIEGSRDESFYINQEKCIKCGECYDVCKFDAVRKK